MFLFWCIAQFLFLLHHFHKLSDCVTHSFDCRGAKIKFAKNRFFRTFRWRWVIRKRSTRHSFILKYMNCCRACVQHKISLVSRLKKMRNLVHMNATYGARGKIYQMLQQSLPKSRWKHTFFDWTKFKLIYISGK